LKFFLAITALIMLLTQVSAPAQSLVTTLTLGPDQIGLVRTAQGITTRITFPDPVVEIVCGDLYDATSGKGSFVVQRSGTSDRPGNDVFLKPIASRGMSNLFVTTSGKRTFNFDLKIVPTEQAHRVVNVVDASPHSAADSGAGGDKSDQTKNSADFEKLKAQAEEQAKQRAAEIIRTAQQQADRKIAEADARIAENERQSTARADREAEHRFVKALMLGLREVRIAKPKATAGKAIISLDPRMLTFDDKAYIRYTIQNTGDEFSFSSIALEVSTDRDSHLLNIEVNQSKAENKLTKDEALTGVIVFDPKQVGPKDKLTLYVRADDNSEIARLIIQQ
jgi:lipoprotein-anchoring transpeptidase ErfK/SrfK